MESSKDDWTLSGTATFLQFLISLIFFSGNPGETGGGGGGLLFWKSRQEGGSCVSGNPGERGG